MYKTGFLSVQLQCSVVLPIAFSFHSFSSCLALLSFCFVDSSRVERDVSTLFFYIFWIQWGYGVIIKTGENIIIMIIKHHQ